MSTDAITGFITRVHRSSSLEELWKNRSKRSPRRDALKAISVAALLAVPAAWTKQDPSERSATLEAISVPAPERSSIPLEMNPLVEQWTHAFQTARSEEFGRLMARRAIYDDMILEKLRARGMPAELLYIPVIESGMYPLAESRVSAVGLWQFMSPTAMQYGLRVDEYVDERRDPVRATDAALDYLSWLHDRFGGSWYLTAAAFNAGPGRVERILNRHADGRRGDDAVFWEVRDYLPRETRAYVPKMIAVARLARDAEIGAHHDPRFTPYEYETVFVPGNTLLSSVARDLDLEVAELWELNPHLVRGVTPPDEIFGVRVPVGQGATVVQALSERQAD